MDNAAIMLIGLTHDARALQSNLCFNQ